MKRLLLCLAFLGSFSTPLFAQDDAAAQKVALAEQRAAEKAALAEQKAAEKAIKDAEKAELKAKKEAEKLALAEEKAREKAIRDAETPEERAERKQAEKLARAEQKAKEKAEKKALKEAPYHMDVHYQPHSTGITYRMGQVGSVGSQTFSFDIYTRQRKGKSQYTPMVSLRFNAPFSSNYIGDLGGHGTWGFLFGGSQYVFDLRSKETGLGWSMLVNGGMTFEFSTVAAVNTFSDILRHTLILGAEMDFKAIYNFNKYVGATVGLTFGYVAAPDFENLINENADPSGVDHGFIWGLSMGLIF